MAATTAPSGAGSAAMLPNTTAAPNSQTPGHPSFRRQRASRACETCHSRKVRCDAANLGVPCTNCTAFAIECRIPAPKRKKTSGKTKDSDSENAESTHAPSPTIENPAGYDIQQSNPADFRNPLQNGMPATTLSDAQTLQQATHNTHFAQFMKPKFARAPIKEAGRVAYLGESSNLSLLVHDRHGTTDVVHYPLPDTVKGSRARMTDLDNLEIEILHQRGAFLLPPRALCDELVESYFKWVAPVVPVINKTRFMQRYRDAKNPPSLLLLQAMLLAGSRVCTNPQLMDANGSTTPAAMTFYKRAKALYDANYEDDRVTIVQALVLMGWYWEGPEDVTKNVFYWTRVATIVAQGSGMHRSVEGSQLSRPDKRLWKRIWWTLFTRDRSVAVALGRPVHINTDDSDVEMVSEDDFIEDEDDQPSKFPPDSVHVQFFLQYVRLCEIMGLVLSQQYSVASKARRQNAIDLTHSDMALADWLQNCPKEVYWEKPRHHFWSALLHSNYYTTLCLLHRAHMPPATYESNGHNGYPTDAAYPSRNIAFQAAGMITSIIESLIAHDELKFTPAFIVYSLFSALIMHVYQMRSSVPSIVTATQERMQVCMNALKEVSKVWLVAKMVHTLFESILGNKMLEDRLQKAAGKKHKKPRLEARPEKDDQSQKRKYDEMELGFTNNGPPAPAMSYERSRPQTPAVTPSQDVGQSAPVAPMAAPPTSPRLRQSNDAFMGGSGSRANTRPPTPFNPSYSVPPTPPDLFLVTRDSPHISQSLWENFQPDQLFPGGTDMSLPPYNAQPNLDPQLQMPPMQQSTMLQPPTMPGHQPIPSRAMHGSHDGQASIHNIQDVAGLPHMQGMQQPNTNPGWPGQYPGDGSPEDTWSNSGRSQAPVAPTTLNVEDWFQFFGMNGDMSGMNGDAINNLLSVPDVTRTEKSTASACGAMNAERPSVTSRNSATTLRSRTRHQAQDDRAYESIVENRSRTSSQSRSPLRDASPIPSKHPSRPARNLHKSTGSDRPLAPQSLFSSQILPNTFATGLWETSWASLQGIASNLLGNETSRSSSKASSPNRKSRPPHTTRGEESKALSRQWGPQATEQRLIGVGTKEDRLAKVQAKKRETLLSANGHINPDGSGRFKRRDSDERVAASAPPSQFEDREALVYLHKVKPEDTLAGVMIKYNCNAPIFRKANRLWPNDRIQIRKVVYLPVDACAVRAHKLSDAEVQMNGLFCSHNEEIIRTPTNVHVPWLSSQSTSETSETIHSSVPTSPSISIFPPDEQPWTHDSWVTLPNLSVPVEVARLSRRSLGFFPPSRRKSVSYTDLETPSASLELPRKDPRTDSRRRDRDRSGSSSGSYFIDRLQGPGGVGTLGREVRSPGPAQDSLNKLFAAHLPNVAPRASFESVHSNSSHGIENMGGAIEGWMRKIASKAKESVQSPAHGPKPGTGDLIELTDAFEVGANDDEHSTERDDDADPATQPALGTWKDDQERLLRERFPPRGRVFAQSPRRKGV